MTYSELLDAWAEVAALAALAGLLAALYPVLAAALIGLATYLNRPR